MPEIFVFPRQIEVFSEDRVRLRVYPLLFPRGRELYDIYDATPEEIEGLSSFRIFRKMFPLLGTALSLPSSVFDGIRSALPNFLGEHESDCYDFVNDVFGIPRHDKDEGSKIWSIRGHARIRKPGDPIFLFDFDEEMFHHASVYLGRGLCLSVNGKCGAVGVARLHTMTEDYGAVQACVMERAQKGDPP